jgi:hypothetical protein
MKRSNGNQPPDVSMARRISRISGEAPADTLWAGFAPSVCCVIAAL